MWYFESEKYGTKAYTSPSHHIRSDVDVSRFAEWVIHNENSIEIKLSIYFPKNIHSCKRVLFSIHGRERNHRKYRNIFVDYVQNENVIIVAPGFKGNMFQKSTSLTLGNMYSGTAAREPLPKELWTFTMLEEIFMLLQSKFAAIETYDVFGHSAGGQFAYRLALFSDSAFRNKVIAANPGWYTILDNTQNYPYGVKDVLTTPQINHVLAKPLILLVGETDTYEDAALRTSLSVQKQGVNRFERAEFAFNYARTIANNNDTEFCWQLMTIRNTGHSAKRTSAVAVNSLFGHTTR